MREEREGEGGRDRKLEEYGYLTSENGRRGGANDHLKELLSC